MSLVCKIHGAQDLRVENELSVELAPHDVEMQLGAGGICGSDLHYYQHGRVGAFVVREPLIPGHEVSGVVARVGSGVTRVKPGDKVAVNPSHPCGHCDYCRGGRLNLCPPAPPVVTGMRLAPVQPAEPPAFHLASALFALLLAAIAAMGAWRQRGRHRFI